MSRDVTSHDAGLLQRSHSADTKMAASGDLCRLQLWQLWQLGNMWRDNEGWKSPGLFSYKVENIRTSKDDTMQCRILPREHRTPGLPWRCWNHCSRSSHKPGGEGRSVTGITGTGADEADEADEARGLLWSSMVFYGLLWSSMLLIFSNFRIAELGIAWRTCEMDRILCHKAVALMDALELGACLKGSLALLIFGTFSIFSFQKHRGTQIIHRS